MPLGSKCLNATFPKQPCPYGPVVRSVLFGLYNEALLVCMKCRVCAFELARQSNDMFIGKPRAGWRTHLHTVLKSHTAERHEKTHGDDDRL